MGWLGSRSDHRAKALTATKLPERAWAKIIESGRPPRLAMITDQKLTVYQRFGGDIDGWPVPATPYEKPLVANRPMQERRRLPPPVTSTGSTTIPIQQLAARAPGAQDGLTMAQLPSDHPFGATWLTKVHARPPAVVPCPAVVSMLALTDTRRSRSSKPSWLWRAAVAPRRPTHHERRMR